MYLISYGLPQGVNYKIDPGFSHQRFEAEKDLWRPSIFSQYLVNIYNI